MSAVTAVERSHVSSPTAAVVAEGAAAAPSQTSPAAPGPAPERAGWWVWVQRDLGEPDAAVGPYPDQDAAVLAMEDSILVQGIVEENCLECFVSQERPAEDTDLYLIDLDDPDHTGRRH